MVAAAILIPMAVIVVLFLGSWVAQFVADRTQVDLEERHKKVMSALPSMYPLLQVLPDGLSALLGKPRDLRESSACAG